MQRPDVKTPAGRRALGEAGEAGNLKADRTAHGARIAGRGTRAYERAKALLPPLAPDDYAAACRDIAKAVGV